jgi:hypothetical protein
MYFVEGLEIRHNKYLMFPMKKEYRKMYLKDNVVLLPKQTMPWILDGKDQPKSIKRVFVTPYGTFPRMIDITNLYGRSRREVEDRRMKRTSRKFDGWYVIPKPTVEDVQKAIDFVNTKYVEVNHDSDNCEVCNAIDESLFRENCWLVSTTHTCATPEDQTPDDVEIVYSYNGVDYEVTLSNWLLGVTPHKVLTTNKPCARIAPS